MYYQDLNSTFVSPEAPATNIVAKTQSINGEEAQRLYLEEINHVNKPDSNKRDVIEKPRKPKRKIKEPAISNNKLFLAVQNNDVVTFFNVTTVIDYYPDKINILDEYGWSLLMIACQANACDCVEELLKRGIDVDLRDSAGYSARSLVIRNKNFTLADMLLKYSESCKSNVKSQIHESTAKVKCKEVFNCSLCNNTFPDKKEHLSSTVHNINASKGKKVITKYEIPLSNKGFQMLLKGGWDRETGLGRYGTGRKCPLRTNPKNDRKGLGHETKNETNKCIKIIPNNHNKKIFANSYMKNKQMEIDFRREFY